MAGSFGMLKRIEKTKLDLTTISGVACCILLNIYKEQLKDIRSVESLRIDFNSNIFTGKYVDHMNNGDELVIKLVGITKNVSILISAFNYLKDKNLFLGHLVLKAHSIIFI